MMQHARIYHFHVEVHYFKLDLQVRNFLNFEEFVSSQAIPGVLMRSCSKNMQYSAYIVAYFKNKFP